MPKALRQTEHHAMTELSSDASGLLERARETGLPLTLTTEGQEVAVLLSFEAFEAMRKTLERFELQQAVDEAERGLAEGRWVEHSEVKAKLDRWAAGEV